MSEIYNLDTLTSDSNQLKPHKVRQKKHILYNLHFLQLQLFSNLKKASVTKAPEICLTLAAGFIWIITVKMDFILFRILKVC